MNKIQVETRDQHHDEDEIQEGRKHSDCNPVASVDNTNGGKTNCNSCHYCNSRTRQNPRIFLCGLVLLLSIAVILPLEILDLVYRDQSLWIRLYGSENIGGADWCEAIDADRTQFIIEPWNSRSDYAFMVWGCFLLVLGISDYFRLSHESSSESSLDQPSFRDEEETGEAAAAISASAELSPPRQKLNLPNPILRFPHITIVNGIFTILHGLGSFWYHACECSYGARADVSGMLSVIVFPIAYTPVQLLATLLPVSSSYKARMTDIILSMLPPICQTLFFVLVWYETMPAIQTFTILVGCVIGVLPLSIAYLFCWRNKKMYETGRQEQQQQHHRLRVWLFPLGLACFGFAYWAWQLDLQGVWCFQEGILVVLQGHAVWHLLSAATLMCVYWIYRSEQITLLVTTTSVDDDSVPEPEVVIVELDRLLDESSTSTKRDDDTQEDAMKNTA